MHQKRLTTETYKTVQQKKRTKEKYTTDPLQVKSDLYASKETYKRDLQKRPITCQN